jgi:hypothetical protein
MKNRVNKVSALGLLGLGITGVVLGTVTIAKGARPKQNPFVIAGNVYPSQSAFVEAGMRCGTPVPSAAQTAAVEGTSGVTSPILTLMRAASASPARVGTITIPVYVHIIRDDNGVGDVTDTQINNQMAVLNSAFAGTRKLSNGTAPIRPAKTLYQFRLMGITRTNKTSWYGLTPGYPVMSTEEAEMKLALKRGGPETLNMYSLNLSGGLLGIARFPWDYASNPAHADGIMLLKDSFPGGTAAPYNLGGTAVHEVGHWVGLRHTFSDENPRACRTSSDFVQDTPTELSPFGGSWTPTTIPDTCTGAQYPGKDPVENYMDYTDDAFYYRFSTGQAQRMDRMCMTYRGL